MADSENFNMVIEDVEDEQLNQRKQSRMKSMRKAAIICRREIVAIILIILVFALIAISINDYKERNILNEKIAELRSDIMGHETYFSSYEKIEGVLVILLNWMKK